MGRGDTAAETWIVGRRPRDKRRACRYGRRVGLADAVTILGVSLLTVRRGLAVAVVVGVVATALRFCWDSCNDLYSAHEVGGSTRTVDLFGTLFFGSAATFADHAQPTASDRAFANSWRRRWVRRTVVRAPSGYIARSADDPRRRVADLRLSQVLNFLHCRVADASAIAALEAACKAYLDLGIAVRLRHLSADARLILRETTQGAVLEERDADPQYARLRPRHREKRITATPRPLLGSSARGLIGVAPGTTSPRRRPSRSSRRSCRRTGRLARRRSSCGRRSEGVLSVVCLLVATHGACLALAYGRRDAPRRVVGERLRAGGASRKNHGAGGVGAKGAPPPRREGGALGRTLSADQNSRGFQHT